MKNSVYSTGVILLAPKTIGRLETEILKASMLNIYDVKLDVVKPA